MKNGNHKKVLINQWLLFNGDIWHANCFNTFAWGREIFHNRIGVNMKKHFLAAAAALVAVGSHAGVLYFDYNKNSLGGTSSPSLFLFGVPNQTASVSNLAGFNQTVTLDSDGFFNLGISATYSQSGTGIRNTGFEVSSGSAIAGYFINRAPYTTDMTYLLDSNALGKNYVVASIGTGGGEGSQMAVHATEDNTTVTITPKGAVAFNVVLNKGETYKYAGGGTDLTGSSIVSDKNVAVFSGHECASVGGTGYCDNLVEQAIPTEKLSKSYLLTASKGAEITTQNRDLVRVIATADNTEVKVNGVVVATINRGQFYEFSLTEATGAQVEASAPVAVAQYLVGGNGARVNGGGTDPALSYVPGQDTWLDAYRLATPSGTAAFNVNYASIVIGTANLTSLMLDGVLVNTAGFSAIGSTGYSRGVIDLPLGLFDLKAASEFLVMLGGGARDDSYFTYGGSTFAPGISPPPPPPNGVPEPGTIALTLGGLIAMQQARARRRRTSGAKAQ